MTAEECRFTTQPQRIRHCGEIFVVDDNGSVRDQLSAVLPLEGFPVTCFVDGATFTATADDRTPVCVFLHIVTSGRSGLDILNELRARHYRSPVFLITTYNHALMDDVAVRNGAWGFLRKPFDPYEAVERVREAVEFWNSSIVATNIPKAATPALPGQVRLTTRESQVLEHMIRGLSSNDIAVALGLGTQTVDHMRMKTMKKLGTKNPADLVRLVTNMG